MASKLDRLLARLPESTVQDIAARGLAAFGDAMRHELSFAEEQPLPFGNAELKVCLCGRGIWHLDDDRGCVRVELFTGETHRCEITDPLHHFLELIQGEMAIQARLDGWTRHYHGEAR